MKTTFLRLLNFLIFAAAVAFGTFILNSFVFRSYNVIGGSAVLGDALLLANRFELFRVGVADHTDLRAPRNRTLQVICAHSKSDHSNHNLIYLHTIDPFFFC